jgi:hypothetical protein
LVDDPAAADVVILHCEPRHYPTLFRTFPILRHRYVVGYEVWEPNIPSDHFRFCLGLVDEIWTSSEYCRAVLGNSAPEVSVIPHMVELPEDNPAAALREKLGDQLIDFASTRSVDSRSARTWEPPFGLSGQHSMATKRFYW